MPERMVDGSTLGSDGVCVPSDVAADAGGIAATVGSESQDDFVLAQGFECVWCKAPSENFDQTEGQLPFGVGGEGGVDDTSTATLTFSSLSKEYGGEEKDVSFRINGPDLHHNGNECADDEMIREYDADCHATPASLAPWGDRHVVGNQTTGIDVGALGGSLLTDPDTSLFPQTPDQVEHIDTRKVEKPFMATTPCFTPGTLIATPRGERPVEDLEVGDRIITRDNGLQEIRWIGKRELSAHELASYPNLQPVLIRSGALGHGLPERDLLLSPQHRILMNSDRAALYFEEREILADAKHLTDLDGVDKVQTPSITYIHFMCDKHEVVLSNGSWTESFQPSEQVMDGLGTDQRNEIFTLFPELCGKEGFASYHTARRLLSEKEVKILVK